MSVAEELVILSYKNVFFFYYFRISYLLGGGLSPAWFHIPNIILHGIVSVLLLLVFSILFGGYEVDPDTEKVRFKAAKSALLCALLFAVHPIHTESVSTRAKNLLLLVTLPTLKFWGLLKLF